MAEVQSTGDFFEVDADRVSQVEPRGVRRRPRRRRRGICWKMGTFHHKNETKLEALIKKIFTLVVVVNFVRKSDLVLHIVHALAPLAPPGHSIFLSTFLAILLLTPVFVDTTNAQFRLPSGFSGSLAALGRICGVVGLPLVRLRAKNIKTTTK